MDKKYDTQELEAALYHLMHFAFIEIRSSESLNAAKKIADIFHNVPMLVHRASSSEDYLNIFEKISKSSSKYNLEEYIDKFKAIAFDQVKK